MRKSEHQNNRVYDIGSYNCPRCCRNLIRTGERRLRYTDCGRIINEVSSLR